MPSRRSVSGSRRNADRVPHSLSCGKAWVGGARAGRTDHDRTHRLPARVQVLDSRPEMRGQKCDFRGRNSGEMKFRAENVAGGFGRRIQLRIGFLNFPAFAVLNRYAEPQPVDDRLQMDAQSLRKRFLSVKGNARPRPASCCGPDGRVKAR